MIAEDSFNAEHFHAIRVVILHDKANLRDNAALAPRLAGRTGRKDTQQPTLLAGAAAAASVVPGSSFDT